jgi:hypothetical protein
MLRKVEEDMVMFWDSLVELERGNFACAKLVSFPTALRIALGEGNR